MTKKDMRQFDDAIQHIDKAAGLLLKMNWTSTDADIFYGRAHNLLERMRNYQLEELSKRISEYQNRDNYDKKD